VRQSTPPSLPASDTPSSRQGQRGGEQQQHKSGNAKQTTATHAPFGHSKLWHRQRCPKFFVTLPPNFSFGAKNFAPKKNYGVRSYSFCDSEEGTLGFCKRNGQPHLAMWHLSMKMIFPLWQNFRLAPKNYGLPLYSFCDSEEGTLGFCKRNGQPHLAMWHLSMKMIHKTP